MDYHTIFVPLKFSPQPLSFLYPLDPLVWMATLISIPMFMLALGFLDMTFYRTSRIHWSSIIEFVLCSAINEHSATEKLRDLRYYKKVLMFTWIFAFFVITQSYAGSQRVLYFPPEEIFLSPVLVWWLKTAADFCLHLLPTYDADKNNCSFNRTDGWWQKVILR